MFPRGFDSPTRFEADVYDYEVWGDIPTDIEGTFYRTLATSSTGRLKTSG